MGKLGKVFWITRTACTMAWKNEGLVWVVPKNCMFMKFKKKSKGLSCYVKLWLEHEWPWKPWFSVLGTELRVLK